MEKAFGDVKSWRYHETQDLYNKDQSKINNNNAVCNKHIFFRRSYMFAFQSNDCEKFRSRYFIMRNITEL